MNRGLTSGTGRQRRNSYYKQRARLVQAGAATVTAAGVVSEYDILGEDPTKRRLDNMWESRQLEFVSLLQPAIEANLCNVILEGDEAARGSPRTRHVQPHQAAEETSGEVDLCKPHVDVITSHEQAESVGTSAVGAQSIVKANLDVQRMRSRFNSTIELDELRAAKTPSPLPPSAFPPLSPHRGILERGVSDVQRLSNAHYKFFATRCPQPNPSYRHRMEKRISIERSFMAGLQSEEKV